MKLLFLPSVAIVTSLQSLAALFVASDKGTTLPIFTKLGVIFKEIWLTPEILEVMRIDALCFVMLMIVGAPLSLEIEDVEVEILILRQ